MDAAQSKCPGFAADFRVGGWLVEPSLDRLSRNGTALRLRPQLVDLLVLLAAHAGHTVSKDTILADVWEGQHVAESGMTRCIAELRQTLGDDAREPTMIQTIPKRGYRLVAPVEFVKTNPAQPATPAGATLAAADAGRPLGPDAAPEEPGVGLPGPGVADAHLDPAEPSPCPAPGAPRRFRRVGWTAGSAVGITALLAFAWGAAGWSPAPILSERDTVLLADVTNSTGDAAFDGALKLALAVHLGQAPFLHILSDGHVRTALALTGRPHDAAVVGPIAMEICRREGAAVMLAGSIARMGSHYAVGIEAVACGSGEPIARELAEAETKEQVLTTLGTLAARLRGTLGESRASLRQHDVPLVRATTPSLDALQALSIGDYNRDHARLEEALASYRRATDLDPTFALAWARRGAAAANLDMPDESVSAFRTAYQLRERVSEPERFYILGHYYRFVNDDPDKAIDTYRMWQRTYPGSAVPPTNLASTYVNTLGRYEDAIADAQEAVRLAPYSSVAVRMLVTAYLGSGKLAEATLALRQAADRGVSDLVWHVLAFQIAFTAGDEAGMAEHARWASGSPSAALAITQQRALASAATGRFREARQLWSDAASAAARSAPASRQAAVRLKEAESEALLGDAGRAGRAADAAVALDDQPGTLLAAAIVHALAGNDARARALIEEAGRRNEPGAYARPVWLALARALVESAAGRHDLARELLRPAARFERGRDFGLAPLGVRGWVELAAGRPREAAAAFEDALLIRAAAPTSPWAAFAHVGLARALREAGDAEASRAVYGAVIGAMRQADADAPLIVAARRERAELGGR